MYQVSEASTPSRRGYNKHRSQSYAVTRKRGLQWKGHKAHMSFQQEACDAECAVIARALEAAALRPLAHERITIYAVAQAAMKDGFGRDRPWPEGRA